MAVVSLNILCVDLVPPLPERTLGRLAFGRSLGTWATVGKAIGAQSALICISEFLFPGACASLCMAFSPEHQLPGLKASLARYLIFFLSN